MTSTSSSGISDRFQHASSTAVAYRAGCLTWAIRLIIPYTAENKDNRIHAALEGA